MIRVLLIGQVPETVDFTNPNLPYGFSVETIKKSLDAALQSMTARGWTADLLQVTPDDATGSTTTAWLSSHEPYDCVVIGAGIRIPSNNLEFFEAVVNAVHHAAPKSHIGFNTRPEETADIVARLLERHRRSCG